MAVTRRTYAGGALKTTIPAGITGSPASFDIAAATGWPTGAPFFVVVDPGLSAEEKILVTRSGITLTVTTRGADGTSSSDHSAGAEIYPCITATDLDEANRLAATLQAQGSLIVGDASGNPLELVKGTSGHPLIAGASTLAYGQLGTAGIADLAVTTAKLNDLAVTSAKIANDAVTGPKLASLVQMIAGLAIEALAAGADFTVDATDLIRLRRNPATTDLIQMDSTSGGRVTIQGSNHAQLASTGGGASRVARLIVQGTNGTWESETGDSLGFAFLNTLRCRLNGQASDHNHGGLVAMVRKGTSAYDGGVDRTPLMKAGSGTITNGNTSVAVSFGFSFPGTPKIIVGNTGAQLTTYSVTSASVSGFTAGRSGSVGTSDFDWLVVWNFE